MVPHVLSQSVLNQLGLFREDVIASYRTETEENKKYECRHIVAKGKLTEVGKQKYGSRENALKGIERQHSRS